VRDDPFGRRAERIGLSGVPLSRGYPGHASGTLFMNDALFVQQGCGSPTAFFEPYLRR